jgi:hypothetical protein
MLLTEKFYNLEPTILLELTTELSLLELVLMENHFHLEKALMASRFLQDTSIQWIPTEEL